MADIQIERDEEGRPSKMVVKVRRLKPFGWSGVFTVLLLGLYGYVVVGLFQAIFFETTYLLKGGEVPWVGAFVTLAIASYFLAVMLFNKQVVVLTPDRLNYYEGPIRTLISASAADPHGTIFDNVIQFKAGKWGSGSRPDRELRIEVRVEKLDYPESDSVFIGFALVRTAEQIADQMNAVFDEMKSQKTRT